MSTLTKIDFVRGVNSRLAEAEATAENLTPAEKQSLLASLEKDVQAAAQKADGPKLLKSLNKCEGDQPQSALAICTAT